MNVDSILGLNAVNACLCASIFLVKVNGINGAMNIVHELKQRGVKLSFVLDEGLPILDGVINGLEGPAAL